jgi:hypothetical protein
MTSRIHAILPRVALASGALLPLVAFLLYRSFTKTYVPPPGTDIFTLVQGTWAWTTSDSSCRTDPETISFTPDRKGMIIALGRPYKLADGTLDSMAYYDILRVTPGSIRGAIRGETRLTADSQPVVWDLVVEAPDRFAWHRTDWASWEHTRDLRRCPTASPRSLQ